MDINKVQFATTIKKVGGYYNFISLVNKRMKELRNNSAPLVEALEGETLIETIVREINAGVLDIELA